MMKDKNQTAACQKTSDVISTLKWRHYAICRFPAYSRTSRSIFQYKIAVFNGAR